MENNYYVYLYIRKDNNSVCYVGKGKDDRDIAFSKHNNHCYSIYKKYGIDVVRIYENLTEKEAHEKEIETIKNYVENLGFGIDIIGYPKNADGFNLCNRTLGGEGMSGNIPSEETKKKLRDSKIGDKNPAKRQDVRDKLSANHKMHKDENVKIQKEKLKEFYNGECGEQRKKEMSNKLKEFYDTDKGKQQKIKMSQLAKERSLTKEGKDNLLNASKKGAETWNLPEAKERKEKMSENLKKYWHTEEGLKKRKEINEKVSGFNSVTAIPIKCIETGKIYSSLVDLSQQTNMKYETLRGRFRNSKDGIIKIKINDKFYSFVKIQKNSI